jgi:hypothetical protein
MNNGWDSDKKKKINEVSRIVGLSQKRIREYEKEGLIKPVREPKTNNRIYTDNDITQINRIKTLIHQKGFTMSCIKYLLTAAPCWSIFDCKHKESCPTYQNPGSVCYEIMGKMTSEGNRLCDSCPVFLNRDNPKFHLLETPPSEE